MSIQQFLKTTFYGALIGVANIIPGLSGGTLAVILGVYTNLIEAIAHVKNQFFKSVQCLLPILLGAGIGILLTNKLMVYLLANHGLVVNFFFIGVIVGSIPMLYRRATQERTATNKPVRWVHLAAGLLAFLTMVVFAVLEQGGTAVVEETVVTVGLLITLFFSGIIAAFSMLIPGISGSFILVLLGVYGIVATAIDDFNVTLLVPMGVGILIGLLFGAKLIGMLMRHFPQLTYWVILGFVAGSIVVLLQKVRLLQQFTGGITLVAAAFLLIIGAVITIWFDRKEKEKP